MVSFSDFEKMVCSFPEVTTEPHFEKISFRVRKKIIATYDEKMHRASLKLCPQDQEDFINKNTSVSKVPNKWGDQGWTFVDLSTVAYECFFTFVKAAYCEVAPKSLSASLQKS